MTRAQAEKIAAEIVTLAEAAGLRRQGNQSVEIETTPELRERLYGDAILVIQCLPLGWKLKAAGATRIVVTRKL